LLDEQEQHELRLKEIDMRQRGITLVEILVVVTMLAFLLVAGLPTIGEWLRNTRIRNASESIQNGLQQARAEAVRRNAHVSFWLVSLPNPSQLTNTCTLSSTSGSWVVSVDSPEAHCADAPSTTVTPKIVAAYPVGDGATGVSVSALQSDGATAASSITFNGFGQVVGAASIARIVLDSTAAGAHRRLRVDISSAGQVRVCDLNVAATTDPRHCPA
jgi:type IV fimbrial biogenesis protein FimT